MMTTTIRKKTPVTIQVQGYAPAQLTVDQLRIGLRKAQIPSTAVVQVVPGGAWVPAEQVVAECIDFPAKAKGLTVGFAVIPLGLWFLNDSLGAGGIGPLVLLAAGIVGATVIRRTPALHNQSSASLLKSRTLLAIVGAAIVVGETPELAVAAVGAIHHARIDAVLSSGNPCDVEQVQKVIAEHGTYEQMSLAAERQTACKEQRYTSGCDGVIAHLDSRGVTPEDLAWLSANASAKDSETISRLAKGTVDGGDLGLKQTDLGCGGRIWDRVVHAVAISQTAWASTATPSDDLKAAVTKIGLAPDVQAALRARAESTALSFARKTASDEMRPGIEACELCSTTGKIAAANRTAFERRPSRSPGSARPA
jgi:hypothetical protein